MKEKEEGRRREREEKGRKRKGKKGRFKRVIIVIKAISKVALQVIQGMTSRWVGLGWKVGLGDI